MAGESVGPSETDVNNNFLRGPIVGGIFKPVDKKPANSTLNLSVLFIILTLVIVGATAINLLKKLGSERIWRYDWK